MRKLFLVKDRPDEEIKEMDDLLDHERNMNFIQFVVMMAVFVFAATGVLKISIEMQRVQKIFAEEIVGVK